MKVSIRREFVLSLFLLWLFCAVSPYGGLSPVLAADILPAPPPGPEKQKPGSNSAPAPIPPTHERPSIDPGIAIPPPTEPHPESVVTPPPIDPKMSIHPQDAPTSKQPSFPSPPASPSPGATQNK